MKVGTWAICAPKKCILNGMHVSSWNNRATAQRNNHSKCCRRKCSFRILLLNDLLIIFPLRIVSLATGVLCQHAVLNITSTVK